MLICDWHFSYLAIISVILLWMKTTEEWSIPASIAVKSLTLQVAPDLQNEVLMSLMDTDPDVVDYLLRRKASQWLWVWLSLLTYVVFTKTSMSESVPDCPLVVNICKLKCMLCPHFWNSQLINPAVCLYLYVFVGLYLNVQLMDLAIGVIHPSVFLNRCEGWNCMSLRRYLTSLPPRNTDLLRSDDHCSLDESHFSSDSNKASSGDISPYDNNSPVLADRSAPQDQGGEPCHVPEHSVLMPHVKTWSKEPWSVQGDAKGEPLRATGTAVHMLEVYLLLSSMLAWFCTYICNGFISKMFGSFTLLYLRVNVRQAGF